MVSARLPLRFMSEDNTKIDLVLVTDGPCITLMMCDYTGEQCWDGNILRIEC